MHTQSYCSVDRCPCENSLLHTLVFSLEKGGRHIGDWHYFFFHFSSDFPHLYFVTWWAFIPNTAFCSIRVAEMGSGTQASKVTVFNKGHSTTHKKIIKCVAFTWTVWCLDCMYNRNIKLNFSRNEKSGIKINVETTNCVGFLSSVVGRTSLTFTIVSKQCSDDNDVKGILFALPLLLHERGWRGG